MGEAAIEQVRKNKEKREEKRAVIMIFLIHWSDFIQEGGRRTRNKIIIFLFI